MKSQILKDEPMYLGLAVNDSVPIQTIISLGITMAWTLDPVHIDYIAKSTNPKILVAGNSKLKHICYQAPHGQGCHQRLMQKGLYFIADIEKVLYCEDYMKETKGVGDINFRKHHCFNTYPIIPDPITKKYWEEKKKRYAIYFKNPSKICNFSNTNFEFSQNPIVFIKP
jgi:hypothetical protein